MLEVGGFEGIEATEAGLREGVFFERLYPEGLSSDVRRDAVRNLASQYDTDFAHSEHVARLALEIWDALRAHGLHDGNAEERELVWATAMLHDIGVAVDYDDHHKHSRYLILNAGLPGFSPRETALIGQAARYHRKGTPSLGEFAPEMRDGDRGGLDRIAACVRFAEQLDAPATSPSTPARSRCTTARPSCTCRPQATPASPAGPPSARPICSSAPSPATSS